MLRQKLFLHSKARTSDGKSDVLWWHPDGRRMTPAEMKRAVGTKIFERFYPKRFINHDAEDPEAIVKLGETGVSMSPCDRRIRPAGASCGYSPIR